MNQGAVLGAASTGDDSGRQCVVPGWTMPSLMSLARFDAVDLLKVDIEGGEDHLFAGDSSWLDRVRCLAIEFHNGTRERSGFDAMMKQFGFAVEEANLHTVVAVRRQSAGGPP